MITVWTNGCFDILHPGHIELFKVAKSLGDRLIVGVDTDEKVSKDKGPERPINNLEYRKAMLESIKYIDVVLPFGSRMELEQSIQLYSPDILLIGGDWRNGDVVGREFAKEVRFFNRVGEYSSTNVINSITSKYNNVGRYL
jgi:D-beta-D-heptose 7-phosphate kinase/D-beta-D-heptose 1-phosphate adenosyltransferase|tara:strand:- start:1016 stop:1438 length:423 start_codon:yes stop_codon:yes gene_type:complete